MTSSTRPSELVRSRLRPLTLYAERLRGAAAGIRGHEPFTEAWTRWRPDRAWPVPRLKPDWESVFPSSLDVICDGTTRKSPAAIGRDSPLWLLCRRMLGTRYWTLLTELA